MSTQKMTDDRSLTFNEIDTWADGTRGRLCNHIETAQTHILSRTLTRKWIAKLKVLIPAPPTETAFDYSLVRHSTLPDPRYIAVSYRWCSSGGVIDYELSRSVRIKQGDKIRLARARPPVIHRAFRYALAVGVESVWIDQECIEQDDREDKEDGIQSMDLVYHNAHCALGLLEECHIEDIVDVESLRNVMAESIKRDGMTIERFSQVDTKLLKKFMRDKWFTRAWISQESMCASTLVLLVAWDKHVAQEQWDETASLSIRLAAESGRRARESEGDVQMVFAEWSISERMLAELASWMVLALDHNDSNESPVLLSEIPASEVLGIITQDGARSDLFLRRGDALSNAFQLLNLDTSSSDSLTTSFKIHTAYVCKVLDAKINSRVADRLAMISNISDHKWGLDVSAVEKKRLSFSACALALSLINGDASLVMRDETNLDRDFNGWLPSGDSTIQELRLAVDFVPGPLNPILVTNSTLFAQGCLWKVVPYTDLTSLHPQLRKRLKAIAEIESRPSFSLREINTLRSHCLHLIIQRLTSLKQWYLIEALVALGISITNPTAFQDTLSNLKSRTIDSWPVMDQMPGGSRVQWLCQQIAEQRPLLTGMSLENGQRRTCFFTSTPHPAPAYVYVVADQFRNVGAGAGYCWTVELLETSPSEDMMKNSIVRLRELSCCNSDTGIRISKETVRVTGFVRAVWSPCHPENEQDFHFIK